MRRLLGGFALINCLVACSWLGVALPVRLPANPCRCRNSGRTYAAHGRVYIVSAIFWLWFADNAKPDRWDASGVIACLAGAAISFGDRDRADIRFLRIPANSKSAGLDFQCL